MLVNGKPWKSFDGKSVFLAYGDTPDTANVQVVMGDAKARTVADAPPQSTPTPAMPAALEPFRAFHARLCDAGLGESYEARHAGLIVDYVAAMEARKKMLESGALAPLPEVSQTAADKSYQETTDKLAEGLRNALKAYEGNDDAHKKQVLAIWKQCAGT